jgi:hypothetical protein
MKAIFFKIRVGIFFSGIILISCTSSEKKDDNAFQQYKQDKITSSDTTLTDSTMLATTNKPVVVKKNENQDEWTIFKTETEKKILANENKIESIKVDPKSSSKLVTKATRLEKDNDDLRNELVIYNQEEKARWEKFKAKMNNDVNGINDQIKNMTIAK